MPALATAAQTITVVLERPRSARQRVEVTVPSGTALPWRAPAIALDSTAVAAAGRVREKDHPFPPVPGAGSCRG
jgi:hypothetical protein